MDDEHKLVSFLAIDAYKSDCKTFVLLMYVLLHRCKSWINLPRFSFSAAQ